MPWDLVRPFKPGDNRSVLSCIHTYDEVVRPRLDGGRWLATVRTLGAKDVMVRQHGFEVIREPILGGDPPAALRKARALAPPAPPAPPVEVKPEPEPEPEPQRTEASDWPATGAGSWPVGCWLNHRHAEFAPLPTLRLPARGVVPKGAEHPGSYEDSPDPIGQDGVAIVMTASLWSADVEAAVVRALEACRSLGPPSGVVLVQNGNAEAATATKAWKPPGWGRRFLRKRYSLNSGFAAACNLGVAGARKEPDWILFTQPDAKWSVDDLGSAAQIAHACRKGMAPAVVGPSGGHVLNYEKGDIREWGRNIGMVGAERLVQSVDFVGGYWLLAHRWVVEELKGWDPGYFLYYEDVDFCLAAAAKVGAMSIVWTGLKVDHERGATIRHKLFHRRVYEQIRKDSRERFVARWQRGRTG